MIRTALASLVLLTAAVSRAEPLLDVPPSVGAPVQPAMSSPIQWPAERLTLQQRRDDRQLAGTLMAAGAGTAVAGYLVSATTAWAGDLGNDLGCAFGGATAAFAGQKATCPPPPTRALYTPVVGPISYLTNSARPKSTEIDAFALFAGISQLAGVAMFVDGLVTWTNLPGASPRPAEGLRLRDAVHVLPAAPGAIAGASLSLQL